MYVLIPVSTYFDVAFVDLNYVKILSYLSFTGSRLCTYLQSRFPHLGMAPLRTDPQRNSTLYHILCLHPPDLRECIVDVVDPRTSLTLCPSSSSRRPRTVQNREEMRLRV